MMKKNSIFSYIKKLFGLAFKVCPVRMLVYMLVIFLNGISSITIAYCMQKFFDKMDIAVKNQQVTGTVIGALVLLILSMLASHILNGLDNYFGTSIHCWVGGRFSQLLNEKAQKIEPVCFEENEFLDKVNKAAEGAGVEGCTFVLVGLIVVLVSKLPYILFMAFYLYCIKPLLAVSVLLIFIPVLISQLLRLRLFSNLEDEAVHIRRESEHYKKCIAFREFFKETRTLGAFPYFYGLYKNSIHELNEKTYRTNKRTVKMEAVMNIITLVGYVWVIILLVHFSMKGAITIGSFAAVFTNINVMFNNMEEAIGNQIGGIAERFPVVKNYFDFMDHEEVQGKVENVDYSKGISCRDMCFSYPNTDKNVLEHINLDIHRNETIAIVGENGAGKSTLAKLLIGLYKPTSGAVCIGNSNTKDVCMRKLHEKISGIFQNFQKYQMTMRDNISISDTTSNPSDEALEIVLGEVNLSLDNLSLKDGWESMLSKEFGGVDLSGGEWQRIAIARGLYRAHDVIILDEPTASIDPIEETNVYNKFAELAKEKLAVLITHRMGSAKIADRIIVLDKGKIVETGSHEELIRKNGKYAKMYAAQAQWY